MTVTTEKSRKPTRKWIVNAVTGVVGLAVMLLTGDRAVSDPEIVAIGTYLTQLALTYRVENDNTPGGVPRKRVRHR